MEKPMKQDGLQAALAEALPLLAQMTNGYGLLADGEGSVVRLAHYSGKDFSRFIGIQLPELGSYCISPGNPVFALVARLRLW